MPRLRIAAIDFLNPAPLLYNFEHSPTSTELATRYDVKYTLPSQCAADLLSGQADLGLIPIAALTEDLAIVPGCTIASLRKVRSIQLIVRGNRPLEDVRTIATDTASRSSLAYTQILFRSFLASNPLFLPPMPADPVTMLSQADAALLIGDPALLAIENRNAIEARIGPCTWIDIAEQWVTHTHLPWVAAVWAVRPEALTPETATQLIDDLTQSRDAGLTHREDLVREWTSRISLSPGVIRHYLNENIHYTLTPDCIRTIELFRAEAASIAALPPLPKLRFLTPEKVADDSSLPF